MQQSTLSKNHSDLKAKLQKCDPSAIASLKPDFLNGSNKPMIVCDIDDVILDYHNPFVKFMKNWNSHFCANSFHYHENFLDDTTCRPLEFDIIYGMFHGFFAKNLLNLCALPDSQEGLARLSQDYDLILLTKMPPEYHHLRKSHLNSLGIDRSLISTRQDKAPILKTLAQFNSADRLVFIDDDPDNINKIIASGVSVTTIHFTFHQKWPSLDASSYPRQADYTLHSWQNLLKIIGHM